jgi:hypothetical protein
MNEQLELAALPSFPASRIARRVRSGPAFSSSTHQAGRVDGERNFRVMGIVAVAGEVAPEPRRRLLAARPWSSLPPSEGLV